MRTRSGTAMMQQKLSSSAPGLVDGGYHRIWGWVKRSRAGPTTTTSAPSVNERWTRLRLRWPLLRAEESKNLQGPESLERAVYGGLSHQAFRRVCRAIRARG
jgi:hypothetical protein